MRCRIAPGSPGVSPKGQKGNAGLKAHQMRTGDMWCIADVICLHCSHYLQTTITKICILQLCILLSTYSWCGGMLIAEVKSCLAMLDAVPSTRHLHPPPADQLLNIQLEASTRRCRLRVLCAPSRHLE